MNKELILTNENAKIIFLIGLSVLYDKLTNPQQCLLLISYASFFGAIIFFNLMTHAETKWLSTTLRTASIISDWCVNLGITWLMTSLLIDKITK